MGEPAEDHGCWLFPQHCSLSVLTPRSWRGLWLGGIWSSGLSEQQLGRTSGTRLGGHHCSRCISGRGHHTVVLATRGHRWPRTAPSPPDRKMTLLPPGWPRLCPESLGVGPVGPILPDPRKSLSPGFFSKNSLRCSGLKEPDKFLNRVGLHSCNSV